MIPNDINNWCVLQWPFEISPMIPNDPQWSPVKFQVILHDVSCSAEALLSTFGSPLSNKKEHWAFIGCPSMSFLWNWCLTGTMHFFKTLLKARNFFHSFRREFASFADAGLHFQLPPTMNLPQSRWAMLGHSRKTMSIQKISVAGIYKI